MKEENIKYYYPCCREKNCNGILGIKINNNNFCIDCICDKNKLHRQNNIYYKTFERFYLKEINIPKCSKCNICLENDLKYECKICEKIYCGFCYIYDEHIKDNTEHLLLINNRCKIHKKDLTLYCKECHEHLCIFCAEQSKDQIHYEHTIEKLYDIIPTENDISKIKNKIKEDKILYEEYINLLDEWMIKINNKIEVYKEKLRNKITLLEKMFNNFYKYFTHFAYYKNFEYFSNIDIKNWIMERLKKHNNLYNFEKVLEKIIDQDEQEDENEFKLSDCYKISFPFTSNIYKIERISDNHFFVQTHDKVRLLYLNENNDLLILKNTEIDFNGEIYSITPSLKKDKIYVCLSNRKCIKIFNCDLPNEIMELNLDEIKYNNNQNNTFKKCIELPNGLLAAAESDLNPIISLWDLNNYSYKDKITINETIGDILLINSEYFVSSQPNINTITFHNINKLNTEKIIKNIKTNTKGHCLTANDKYLLTCNDKGISVISIKYQEFIQYFETPEDYIQSYDINIKIDKNNYIYYLYYNGSSFNSSTKTYLDIYKLNNNKITEYARYSNNLEYENVERDIKIYINQKDEISYISAGIIFICDKVENEDEDEDKEDDIF